MPPDVSIVVVNYRTPELAVRALRSASASARTLSVEELVVDSGSGDGSAAAIARGCPDAQVIELPSNQGYAAALNAGIAASTGGALFLINSDAFAEDDALARLENYLRRHPRVAVVAPRLQDPHGTLQINAYRRFPNLLTLFAEFFLPLHMVHGTALHPHTLPRKRFDQAGPVAHAMGAALLVRRDAADAVGPFDERYFLYLEETEWQRRIAARGWEIHLEPAAVVTHLGQASDPDAQVFSEHYVESALRYFGPRALPVMRAGSAISLTAARLAARVRPSDPRFPKLVRAFDEVRQQLQDRQGSASARR